MERKVHGRIGRRDGHDQRLRPPRHAPRPDRNPLAATGRPPVLGAWSGQDSGSTVLYQFDRNGSGVCTVQGLCEPFRPGYPTDANPAGPGEPTLVEISDRTLRLEWGESGEAPPRQLTTRALVLHTLASS